MEKERGLRLRQHLEHLIRSRLGLLEQDISRLQREVNESFTRLLEQTDAAGAMPESDQLLAQIEAEVGASIDEASARGVRLGTDIALLKDSVIELDQQRNQAEVLNTLVSRAANFAPRVVLFVVKGSNALAWAARGFDDTIGNNAIRGISFSLDADTVLRTAMNSQQIFYGSPDEQAENYLLLSRLGNLQPQRVLSVPLRVRRKTAALLYADSADRGDEAVNVEGIELLVHTAGIVVELVSLRARVSEAQPAAKAEAQPSAAASAGAKMNEPLSASTEALLHPRVSTSGELRQPASSGELRQPASSGDLRQPAPSGDLRQPATPTYFRPAAEPPTPEPPVIAKSGPLVEPPRIEAAPPKGAMSEEEEKQHNDARRFARLLVSEIKLYNEQKVTEGRRNRDLYDRLKEDIDRSRQMYDKRVSPAVAARLDYFYDELVNTLAEGDSNKLGANCPGPTSG
ncbi:MAG: hypothetical protein AB1631_30180 [Acidobacteriota bacterium]